MDLAHMSMNMLETAVDNDETVVEDLILEANDVATELEQHVGARKLVMEERFGSLKAKLATLLGAATYQGSGMLDPQQNAWRNQVQSIMQNMNMDDDQFEMRRP